ncbi:hypothetical protein [Sulfuriroseicoccus oceanibius]|uniref:Uncharacterized protein n=1 Tax=Sulfuriroseicoccus oceanibius TaxID=2707525 RepID=A0A6B3L8Q4_9BACT|nr:hypothetical protein [Sulfuriroseicoccus oceanibius]QQL44625.1 hypothetical protein G3M56_012140 [Sulfuriroseicoccus oceanibius]
MPDRFYLELESVEQPSGETLHRYRKYIDSESHWEQEQGNLISDRSTPRELAEARQTFFAALGLISHDQFDLVVLEPGLQNVNGAHCHVVVAQTGESKLRMFVDPTQYRIRRVVIDAPDGKQQFEMTDFKTFDTVTIGTKATGSGHERTIENLAINQPVDRSLFELP